MTVNADIIGSLCMVLTVREYSEREVLDIVIQ